MNKLLSANFARMKKNKVFLILMILLFAMGVNSPIKNYIKNLSTDYKVSLDQIYFNYAILIGILTSVLSSLYIGTEYSDGTIRNKLVLGFSRRTIYLTNFIVCAAAGILMSFTFLITVSILGIPLLGFFQTDFKVILCYVFASIMMILAFTSIFTLISMMIQNKTTAAVINILGVFALFVLASYLHSCLTNPEFYPEFIMTDSLGNVKEQLVANPGYLRGTKRTIYQFLIDFVPTGQSILIETRSAVHLLLMPLYSLLITITVTITGVFLFNKKDIK